jgi:hypothetical protein
VITTKLEDGLKTIKEYAQKQQFMNMLGQEAFWKKNRLLLWNELAKHAVTTQADEKDHIIKTDFINTDYMIGQIAYRLKEYYAQIYEHRESNIIEGPQHYRTMDHYDYNQRDGRYKALRVRRVYPDNLEVRHADLIEFNREMEALYKKYKVKDANRLQKGKRYYDHNEAAKRLVRIHYKIGQTLY